MWNAASVMEHIEDGHSYGIFNSVPGSPDSPINPVLHWPALIEKRDKYIVRLNGIYQRLLTNSNVTVINGFGTLTSTPNVVHVRNANGEEREIESKHIVLCPGGSPARGEGEIDGHELAITSDEFWDLKERPDSVGIIGAGYIAVELACTLRKLG